MTNEHKEFVGLKKPIIIIKIIIIENISFDSLKECVSIIASHNPRHLLFIPGAAASYNYFPLALIVYD